MEWKWEGQLHMHYVSPRGQLGLTVFFCHTHLASAIILSCAKGLSLLQGSLALSGSYRPRICWLNVPSLKRLHAQGGSISHGQANNEELGAGGRRWLLVKDGAQFMEESKCLLALIQVTQVFWLNKLCAGSQLSFAGGDSPLCALTDTPTWLTAPTGRFQVIELPAWKTLPKMQERRYFWFVW